VEQVWQLLLLCLFCRLLCRLGEFTWPITWYTTWPKVCGQLHVEHLIQKLWALIWSWSPPLLL
jgi:hypothetical protein